jgi:hypothetical protein
MIARMLIAVEEKEKILKFSGTVRDVREKTVHIEFQATISWNAK